MCSTIIMKTVWHCILIISFGVILGSCQTPSSNFNKAQVEWSGAYDYVIVGAGAAGSVVAGRLSEDPKNSVLVIEAGFDDAFVPFLDVPFAARYLLDPNVGVKWDYKTEPQLYACKSFQENRSFWPQGKVLGGSTSINWMQYIRGSRADFDGWAALGNQGWSFDDVLPYFKKSERNLNTNLNPAYHAFDGPWVISDQTPSPEAVSRFLAAGAELGYDILEPNDPSHTGFSRFQSDTFLGRRMNLAKTFLKPNMGRPNLKVLTLGHVTKILISKSKARGVQYLDLQTQQAISIKAKKEVIVSAGAIGSPKLLMLSGIGPSDHLQDLGIPVLSDLPAGKSLEDHYLVPIIYTHNSSVTPTPQEFSSAETLSQYIFTGTGPWSSAGTLAVAAFTPENSAFGGTLDTLQVQMFNFLLGASGPEEVIHLFGFKPEVAISLLSSVQGKAGIMLTLSLLHPLARGSVTLRSLNPLENPRIVLNYLEHSEDLDELITGVRFIQELMATDPFQEIDAKLAIDFHPDCVQHAADSDDFWECYLRQLTTSGYHYVGTCRMGDDVADSVVNNELKVHGIKRLRVVDASVMPVTVSANTMATTVMIGEKAADLIQNINTV